MKAIWMSDRGQALLDTIYTGALREKLEAQVQFVSTITSAQEAQASKEQLKDVECIFSTWGMLPLSAEQIRECFPSLKAVFYGAGSVQYFARPFLQSGVRVFSSAAANAVPVAEYTLAQILLAGKGFYQASRLYKEGQHKKAQEFSKRHTGNYDAVVGIIGAGMIGKLVIRMLKDYRFRILCFDPFLPEKAAEELGVKKTGLQELFAESDVISNHLANNAQTVGMLDYGCFSKMKPYATFLNTGRGAQVVEADLAQALKEEPGRTAVLDVTWPEPVEEGHEFLSLPNVVLTPHIAGSMSQETSRMGDYQIQEFFAWIEGKELSLEVTEAMLRTMA